MTERKIIRLYKGNLAPGESDTFCYTPKKHEKKAIGILVSRDRELSVAFGNGTDLALNSVVHATIVKRNMHDVIFRVSEELQGRVIRGRVAREQQFSPVATSNTSVYLVIESER
ncbi:MAG: hypothetical protein KDD36_09275 [Flavobacteriales bacterium]|nr:hypothetical protein [Flavobacteriales bacterium]